MSFPSLFQKQVLIPRKTGRARFKNRARRSEYRKSIEWEYADSSYLEEFRLRKSVGRCCFQVISRKSIYTCDVSIFLVFRNICFGYFCAIAFLDLLLDLFAAYEQRRIVERNLLSKSDSLRFARSNFVLTMAIMAAISKKKWTFPMRTEKRLET